MKRLLLLVPVVFFLFTVPAQAAEPITDEGAEKLKKIASDLLEYQKSAYNLGGGELRTDGDITIEQAENYYAVTLPAITTITPTGLRGEIGMIAINARPGDKEDQWKMAVAMPTPVTYFDDEDRPVMLVNLGAQRFSGIWDEKLSNFYKMDAAYKDIRVEDLQNHIITTFSEMDITMDLTENQEDTWSGPMSLSVVDLKAASKSKDITYFSLDRATAQINIMNLSADANREMQEKLAAFGENTNPEDLENMNKNQQLAFFDMITDALNSAGDGYTMQTEAKNLSISAPNLEKPIRFAVAGFGMDMTGLQDEKAKIALRFSFDGIDAPQTKTPMGDLAPSRLNLDISANNLPFNKLFDLGRKTIESAKDKNASTVAKTKFMQAMPVILTESGSNLTLTKSMIGNHIYQLDADGVLKAKAGTATGATGNLKATISGLDQVVAKVQESSKDASPQTQKKIQQTLATIAIMGAMGQNAETPDGKVTKTYDLTLDEQGQIILNGNNLSDIMNMGQATKKPEKPKKEPSKPSSAIEDTTAPR